MNEKRNLVTAVVVTALLSSSATTAVDQMRWQAHERQRQEDARRSMERIEAEVRAMNIHRTPDEQQ